MSIRFDEYVFPDRLEKTLNILAANKDTFSGYIAFYGEPGTGKTSVAKKLGKLFDDVIYVSCSEDGLSKKDWEMIKTRIRTRALDHLNEKGRLFIIDEFHNLPTNKQDKFKTLYEDLGEQDLFIFIFNTDRRPYGKQRMLRDCLSSAMLSRCSPQISFDVTQEEKSSVLDKARKVYSNLDEKVVEQLLPDHRQLRKQDNIVALFS